MKFFKKSKKNLVTSLAAFATMLCAVFGVGMLHTVRSNAATLSSATFQTDGASVRVFQYNGETKAYEPTSKTGIRFHVEMGEGYTVDNGTVLFDTETLHDRGSFTIAEGYTTKTLVLPTRLLSGDLTLATPNVMAIDTTEYWFEDTDGNWESVAYLYKIPANRYTDNFSFRGVVLNAEGNVVAQTEVAERSLTWVAKQAYTDTIDPSYNEWLTEENDTAAAEMIKEFIPVYTINYPNGTKEEVLWGDKPTSEYLASSSAWYDTLNSEEVNVNQEMLWTENRTITLTNTSSEEFVLTGVAAQDNYVANGTSYDGFKIYATLHVEAFANNTALDIHAVKIEHKRNGVALNDGLSLKGVWTMQEGNQMRLFFAIDDMNDSTDNVDLQSGDQIVLKGSSVFYANNTMYKLTEDYVIDYTEVNGVEDYGMFLGYLYNSNVQSISNAAENAGGDKNAAYDDFTIRITFYDDIMITGSFEFVNDNLPAGYEAPVYVKCGHEKDANGNPVIHPIKGGEYYWNNGDYKILELIAEETNAAYGYHSGDELIGAPGTILRQNGGYYIFEDQMYAYFLPTNVDQNGNGIRDDKGAVAGQWLVGEGLAEYTASEFAETGAFVGYDSDGVPAQEIRINTASHWFEENYKVSILTVENMSKTAPYGVYWTSNGAVKEIGKVVYHGQTAPNGGAYQIIAFRGLDSAKEGDTLTIAAGTRFWLGTQYHTVQEEVTYYYTGAQWLKNFDESEIKELKLSAFNFKSYNEGTTDIYLQLNGALEGMPTTDRAWTEFTIGHGSVTMKGNAVASVHYYRYDANAIFLVVRGFIGQNKFADDLVFAPNTTLWAGATCYQIPEEGMSFIYTGYSRHYDYGYDFWDKHEWMLDTGVNVNVSASDFNRIENSIDGMYGEEVRFYLTTNKLNTAYYDNPVAAINSRNPVLFNGQPVAGGQYYGRDGILAVVDPYGTKDGDCIIIPEGSVWWTKNGGTVTFTEEIIATYAGGAWKKGDYRASVTVNGNATVTGLNGIAKGQTYTIKVAANAGYVVSSVVINGTTYDVNANGTYTFTAQADNSIVVNTVVGYNVTFSVPEGALVDNGAIVNGTIKAVEDSLTFTVTAKEGYAIVGVNGATSIGNNQYKVTPSANTTVSISVEKMYKVTWTAENANISSDISNGAWVTNGTTVTLNITVNNGYSLISVTGATRVDSGSSTYTVTVNGANVSIAVKAMKSDSFVDITQRISMEDRAWGAHDGEVYVGLLDLGITNAGGDHYFNTSVNNTWYAGNNDIIAANGGVDIMEYIYVNGVSARKLITDNANGERKANACKCWMSNPAAYPVYVETTIGSGLMIRLGKATFGTNFNLTLKAGFMITNANGQLVAITKDVIFTYVNGAIAKTIDAKQYTVTLNGTTGAVITANGAAVSSGASYYEDTVITIAPDGLHDISKVVVNGNTLALENGVYTFVLKENSTISVTSSVKATDITDYLNVENRAWGAHDGEYYFGVLDTRESNKAANGSYYFNTALKAEQGTWFVGNNEIIQANSGLDIMEYIYVNGVSARKLITDNANGERLSNTCGCWLSNPAAYPVYVETTNGSGIIIRIAKAYAGDTVTLTFKAGFAITNAAGENVAVTRDITFTYANGAITKA